MQLYECSGATLWEWKHESSQKDIHSLLRSSFDYTVTQGQFGLDDSLILEEDPHVSGQYVLRVLYKKGTYSGHSSYRGAQFYVQPHAMAGHTYTTLTLEYDVLFQSGFGFQRGGKLPGLWGGARTCSGGRSSEDCFSTRLMWRAHGDGEVYAYVTHHQTDAWSSFCSKYTHRDVYQRIHCTHDNYGTQLGSGSFRFRTNHWTHVKETVHLNSQPGLHGSIALWIDGHAEVYIRDIVMRNTRDFDIDGIFFSTFYGGGDSSWACPHDTSTYFKNFKLSTGSSTPSSSELVICCRFTAPKIQEEVVRTPRTPFTTRVKEWIVF